MDNSWAAVIDKHWPWLILVAVAVVGIPYVMKALGILRGVFWTPVIGYLKRAGLKEQQRIDAELSDLRRQVAFLALQVNELRYRDAMSWAWILSDQEWHRKVELEAITKEWDIPDHISYEEFREAWVKAHPPITEPSLIVGSM